MMSMFGYTLAQNSPPLSRPGDVVGKAVIGYQGWFAAPKDGSPINGWVHWIKDVSKTKHFLNTKIQF